MRYRLKHMLEYSLLRALHFVVNSTSERVALCMGVTLAWLAQVTMRTRMKEARRRIHEVFGDTVSNQEAHRIARLSLQSITLNGIEMLRMSRLDEHWAKDHIVNHEVIEPLREHLRSGQGAILAAPHIGNWHLAAVGMNHLCVPTFFVIAHQRNPLTNRFINQMLAAGGGEGVCRKTGSMRAIIRNLRAGKTLAITPDVRSQQSAVSVTYLGGRANIPDGMALFARQTHVPIFPCSTVREGLMRHRWTLHEPIIPDVSLDKVTDVQRMTQLVMSALEVDVRANPSQYFWFNKRWILEPLFRGDGSATAPHPLYGPISPSVRQCPGG